MLQVKVNFDGSFMYGSSEHYYHFTMGYLFPALQVIRHRNHSQEQYLFQSCGPKMTPMIAEAADLLGLTYRIIDPSEPCDAQNVIHVPRWDVLCLRPHLAGLKEEDHVQFHNLRDYIVKNRPDIWHQISAPAVSEEFRKEITDFRDWLLGFFRKTVEGRAVIEPDITLVLRRSKELPFYAKDGAAKHKGYGEGRRTLMNIERSVQDLCQLGVKSVAFECGAHSLADQALAFNACNGLAMIRGAEVANLIWCRPGTRVFVVVPREMEIYPPPHDGISELIGISIRQVFAETNSPELDVDSVAEFLLGK